MSLDPHALKIYIDGSALRNPGGSGGLAAWIEFPMQWNRPDEPLFQEGFRETTNNRMELLACIRAFEFVSASAFDVSIQRIQIVTDSQYVHENLFRAPEWRKNGWRNNHGKPIENRDLWKSVLAVRNKVRVRTELKWMLGKKSPILKAVDKSAKTAASMPWNIDRGFKGGKIARAKTTFRGVASMFPAKGQEVTIEIYRNRPVGRSDHKIYFLIYSEQTSVFEEKAYAFACPEVALDLHRRHHYRVLFNGNPKYPIIEQILHEIPRT